MFEVVKRFTKTGGRSVVEVQRVDRSPKLRVVVDTGRWIDNPLLYTDTTGWQRILYDFPERVPGYAKDLAAKAFRWIATQEGAQ